MKKSNFVLISIVLLAACSAAPVQEKRVQERVEKEVKAAPPAPAPLLQIKTDPAAFDSSSLTSAQKKRLKDLYSDNNSEQERLKKELAKNKAVLMKSLVSQDSKEEEIELLKNRILELERERTSLFMSTLDQAESILGRKDLKDERVYRAFLMNPTEPQVLP